MASQGRQRGGELRPAVGEDEDLARRRMAQEHARRLGQRRERDRGLDVLDAAALVRQVDPRHGAGDALHGAPQEDPRVRLVAVAQQPAHLVRSHVAVAVGRAVGGELGGLAVAEDRGRREAERHQRRREARGGERRDRGAARDAQRHDARAAAEQQRDEDRDVLLTASYAVTAVAPRLRTSSVAIAVAPTIDQRWRRPNGHRRSSASRIAGSAKHGVTAVMLYAHHVSTVDDVKSPRNSQTIAVYAIATCATRAATPLPARRRPMRTTVARQAIGGA